MLSKVVDYSAGELITEDYLEAIVNGTMQLWLALDGKDIKMTMLTQIIPYPQKNILRVIAISGNDFKQVYEKFNDTLESYALKHDCSALELWGRKGWKKMLPDWNDTYTVFTKDLKKRMH